MPARSSGRHDGLAKNTVSQQEQRPRPPLNAYVNGQPRRGLIMQLFMIVLGFVTWQLAPASASLVGKLSGGLFVYALSLPEAFRVAKLRQLAFEHGNEPKHRSDVDV